MNFLTVEIRSSDERAGNDTLRNPTIVSKVVVVIGHLLSTGMGAQKPTPA